MSPRTEPPNRSPFELHEHGACGLAVFGANASVAYQDLRIVSKPFAVTRVELYATSWFGRLE